MNKTIRKAYDEVMAAFAKAERGLSDEEYVDLCDELECVFNSNATAKREELDREE